MLSLVVDDEPKIRAYIKAVLRRSALKSSEAEGGNQALEIVDVVHGASISSSPTFRCRTAMD